MTNEPTTPPRDWHEAFAALPGAAPPPGSWARLCAALDAADADDDASTLESAGAGCMAEAASAPNAAGATGATGTASAMSGVNSANGASAKRAPSRRRLLPLALAASLALLAPVLAPRLTDDAVPAGPASTASTATTPHDAPADRVSSGLLHETPVENASMGAGAHEAGRSTARVDAASVGAGRTDVIPDPTTERRSADASVPIDPAGTRRTLVAAASRHASSHGASADTAGHATGPEKTALPEHLPVYPASRMAGDRKIVQASEKPRPAIVAPRGSTAPPAVDPLQPLYAEAAQLEALLALTRDDRVASASGAALADALADRIASVDLRLAQPGLSDAERTSLWHERLAALRQLAGVESTERWLAVHGHVYGDAFVRVD